MAAGSGACNNLVRSLRASDAGVYIVGCNDDRFTLKQSGADRLYLMPPVTAASFGSALLQLLDHEQITLVIPSGDGDVIALSALRDKLGSRCFLPEHGVIDLCQDKFELARFLAARNVPVPATYAVTDLAGIGAIFKQLGKARPVWCRARVGSRSLGAAPVNTVQQARAWIRYWEEMRGIPAERFTLSEYLPGRDFMCMSLWRTAEWCWSPRSRSSPTSAVKHTRADIIPFVPGEDRHRPAAGRRLLSGDSGALPRISGAFSVDLKENRAGIPCITEINAGRFFIGMTAFDQCSRHSLSLTYVRLALDEPFDVQASYVTVPDYYVVRDLDTLPGVLSAEALFTDVNACGLNGRMRPVD